MINASEIVSQFVPAQDIPVGGLAVLTDGGWTLPVRLTRVVHGVPYVQVIGLDTTVPFWGQEIVTFWSRLRPGL